MSTCGGVMLPRKVLLFSHMIDAPGRKEMRFPTDKEPTATDAMARTLDEIDVGSNDLATELWN